MIIDETKQFKVKDIFTNDLLVTIDNLIKEFNYNLQNTTISGSRKALQKGNSIEFSDFREYSIGDDIRKIDWNAYARFQILYIKEFYCENKGALNLFLDCSLSMDFNSHNKFIMAKVAIAFFVYIGIEKGDLVNIFAVNKNIENISCSNKIQFIEILNWLDNCKCKSNNEPTKSITSIPILHKGMSVIVSDFLYEFEIEKFIELLYVKGQKPYLIQVMSKEEENPSCIGQSYKMIDCEKNKEGFNINVTESLLKSYKETILNYKNDLYNICYNKGVVFLSVSEDMDLLMIFRKILGL